jgi:hypothetical protein
MHINRERGLMLQSIGESLAVSGICCILGQIFLPQWAWQEVHGEAYCQASEGSEAKLEIFEGHFELWVGLHSRRQRGTVGRLY